MSQHNMSEKKSIVSAGKFRMALSKVLRAAAKKCTVPCLDEARADFHGDTCTLTCTDLVHWCQVTIPAQGDDFSFVFHNTRNLLTACKYFSGDLELEYTKNEESAVTYPDGSLTLRCGNKSSIQLVTAAADFPDLPEVEAEHTYTTNTGSLYKRYRRIKYAASKKDNARPYRCCIEFLDNRMLAIDGYRMALSRDDTFHVEQHFFVPTKALDLLTVFNGANCHMEVGKLRAAFDNGSIRVVTRLQEGDGLDVDRLVPQKFSEEHTVSVEDFSSNLSYLYEFVKDKTPIRYDGGVLSVKTNGGEYRSSLELESVSQAVCGFNAVYMLNGLNQFKAKKVKSVTMRLDRPVAPIVLTDDGGDIAMVLPVRLKKSA